VAHHRHLARFALAASSLALAACHDPPSDAECDADPLIEGCAPPEPAFPPLSAAVEIIRDGSGVPHVFATTDADAYYASGYMQAFDRLFQMDLTRRQALGRRAEVLGADFIDDDRLVRIVDLPRWGRTNAIALLRDDPVGYELVQAWTAGVNRRIREVVSGAAPLPPEFTSLGYMPEEWTVADGFTVGRLLLFGNANQLQFDILTSILDHYLTDLPPRLLPAMPMRDAFVVPPDERPTTLSLPLTPPFTGPMAHADRPLPPDARERLTRFVRSLEIFRTRGSNNWAIDGAHTATGRPLIAGDPHQGLTSPGIFWLHHMRSDEELDVVGWSFVGTPAVQLGHNRSIAWTATTSYPDMMDLWEVAPHHDGVMIAGHAVEVVRRLETIEVAGGVPVPLVLEDVPGYGVLLPIDFVPLPIGRVDRRLLFNWTGFRPTHEGTGFHQVDVSTSIDDFDAAIDLMETGAFNFIAADATGITYRSSPLVPIRPAGILPYVLLDGDDPDTFWTGGYLDAARLPHSRATARGWIASANNDPFGFLADGSIESDPWYFGVYFDPGTRASRIESEIARLVAAGPVTVADMQALQADTYSIFAEDFVPELVATWATVPTDPMLVPFRGRPELDDLVTRLSTWNRRMDRLLAEPVVFNAFTFFLARRVLADDFSIAFEPILGESPAYVMKFLSNVLRGRAPGSASFFAGEARQVSIARALEETATYLMTQFGSTTTGYTWGMIHGTRFPSIHGTRLDGNWVATDGGEGTVDVSSTGFFDSSGDPNVRLESGGGAVYRMVAGFRADDRPEAFFNMARGVSGEPTTSHWDDLHLDWIETTYRPLLFDRTEVEAGPTENMTLMPE
jgi:penicillin amidase